mmetsp:Transcript_73336/g.218909  ORF Transcript_73336/g.218909 Transcript_73336/m.218909 type:complete len:258 (-) Transcript_73336:88-861(-)
MGPRQSRTTPSTSPAEQRQSFKLFEYQCPSCRAKRPIQYFYRNGAFLPQTPRVVCGECSTSVVVEPFRTVDYGCPSCKRWQKARLPGRPIPLNLYNVSVVSCNCGFRGEVSVGRLMDVACSACWAHRVELRDVWAEEGDEIRTYCGACQDYNRSFVRMPRKKGAEQEADLEYTCDNCFRSQSIGAEELLRTDGLACCSLCGWVGYPEAVPKGFGDGLATHTATSQKAHKKAGKRRASTGTGTRRGTARQPDGVVPTG